MTFSSFLFDYNGVLVDDEHVHLAAFLDVLRPLGIEVSLAEYDAKYLGFDDAGAFRAILTDRALACDDAKIAALVAAKQPKYLERAQRGLRVFDGASALLNRLAARGAIVGIVSGALRNEIELGLTVLDAQRAVRFIVSAEDTRACKPDPEGYLIGCVELKRVAGDAAAKHVLVVEDSLAGIAAALAAGLPCAAVAHSYAEAELRAAGATFVVTHLADLTDTLLAQWAVTYAAAQR